MGSCAAPAPRYAAPPAAPRATAAASRPLCDPRGTWRLRYDVAESTCVAPGRGRFTLVLERAGAGYQVVVDGEAFAARATFGKEPSWCETKVSWMAPQPRTRRAGPAEPPRRYELVLRHVSDVVEGYGKWVSPSRDPGDRPATCRAGFLVAGQFEPAVITVEGGATGADPLAPSR